MQSQSEMSTRDFIGFLRTYILSTRHVEKKRILVERRHLLDSCRAPALWDIYLARGNKESQRFFQENGVAMCFIQNNDFSVYFLINAHIMKKFKEAHRGLEFISESSEKGGLQFLDINMAFGDRLTCWMYKTRREKGMLPCDSGHSKLGKRSVASGCVCQVVRKLCSHRVSEGLRIRISWLQASGCPEPPVVAIEEKCINTLAGKDKTKEKKVDRTPVVVLPYIHNFSHRMKKISKNHRVRVALS